MLNVFGGSGILYTVIKKIVYIFIVRWRCTASNHNSAQTHVQSSKGLNFYSSLTGYWNVKECLSFWSFAVSTAIYKRKCELFYKLLYIRFISYLKIFINTLYQIYQKASSFLFFDFLELYIHTNENN